MKKFKIDGVSETMLQTLYARAKESSKKKALIKDDKAIEIINQIDYDFTKANQDQAMSKGVIARTIILDQLTKDYLTKNKDSIVINLACGLDTRCYRFEQLYSNWYNIDLLDVMKIRSYFMNETNKIHQIIGSAMNDEWAINIKQDQKPLLIIIEGLSMYLNEDDIKTIFNIIDKHFNNVTIFIEVMNPFVCKHFKEKSIDQSKALFTFGIKNGIELAKFNQNFKYVKEISLVEGMKQIMPIYKIIGKIGFVKNISNKIIILEKSHNF